MIVDGGQERILALRAHRAREVVHVERPDHGAAEATLDDVLRFRLDRAHVVEAHPFERSEWCREKLVSVRVRHFLLIVPHVVPVVHEDLLAHLVIGF